MVGWVWRVKEFVGGNRVGMEGGRVGRRGMGEGWRVGRMLMESGRVCRREWIEG